MVSVVHILSSRRKRRFHICTEGGVAAPLDPLQAHVAPAVGGQARVTNLIASGEASGGQTPPRVP